MIRKSRFASSLVIAAAVLCFAVTPDRPAAPTVAGGGSTTEARPASRASAVPVSETPAGAPPAAAQAKPRSGAPAAETAPVGGPRQEEEEEEEIGGAGDPGSTAQLTYRGGAVQTSPKIYLIFWGANWFTGGDPSGVANRLHYFYSGVGGAGINNILKQYSDSAGRVYTNAAGQYVGWWQDKTAVPSNPTEADIAAAAKRAALALKDYSYNAQYVIALPWGVVDQKSTANGWCAWHNYTYVSGSYWVTYTSLPYVPYYDAIGRGCGKNSVNAGSAGILDGVTVMAYHEYVETVNDPSLSTWLDSSNAENGDKCAWAAGAVANKKLTNGYTFPVQTYWSNAWRTTYGNGCLWAA